MTSSLPTSFRRPLCLMAACVLVAIAPGRVGATPDRDAAAQAPAGLAGTAVPIGGGLEAGNHAVWNRLVQAAGGRGARFVVLPTASGEPQTSGPEAAANLVRHGARARVLPVSPLLKGVDVAKAVNDPALVRAVERSTGVFFTGGAQERIVDALLPGGRPTPLLRAIRGVLARGGVVAGTSAGAAIMSDPMFRDAPDLVAVLQGRLRTGQEVDRGLGFAGDGVYVDQHFLRRGRIGRLLPAMVASGRTLGVGVEENTAAFFHGQEIEVVGAGGVVVVDLAEATSDAATLPAGFSIEGARVSLLVAGDRYRRDTRQVLPSAAKRAGHVIDPADTRYVPEHEFADTVIDVLADQAFARAMIALIDNRARELRGLAFRPAPLPDEPHPGQGFEFVLSKDARSRGWYVETDGPDDYTVAGLRLDVHPVRMAQPLFRPWTSVAGPAPAPASSPR